MNATATSDGLTIETDVTGLASLRALARDLTGKRRPTMADVKKMVISSHNAFCPKGCRYPIERASKLVTIVVK